MNRCQSPPSPAREYINFQLVEDWLQELLDKDRDNEKPDTRRKRAAYRMSSSPSTRRTPSPTKRRRIHEGDENGEAPIDDGGFGQDLDSRDIATSRPNRILPERNKSDLLHTPAASDKELNRVGDGRHRDTLSDTSSVSRRSGRSSPAKREVAMRNANDLPLQRVPLKELLALPSADPATTLLVKDLSTIRQKIGILPRALKPLLESQESIDDPLNDTMFYTNLTAAAGSSVDCDNNLEFQHRRLLRICKSSLQCSDPARQVHEAEWNDKVHAPILELALDVNRGSDESLVFHNVTDSRIAARFRDSSALLKDNMVDYGVFLAPAVPSPLGSLIASFTASSLSLAQFNALESFEVDRPLAIAIETKRPRGGDANAPSQLANFARAHFRVARYLFRPSNRDIGISESLTSVMQPSRVTKPIARSLMLPLIEVIGSSWRISFAILDVDRVLISSDLAMGSTDQISDCYVLFQSLLRLAQWVESECTAWWTAHLQASQGQAR
ncbi:hypothetical protein SAMD00023353_3300060 [Rosellinia necatrix]|uniref:PD-(D/E)XK nuclease-like domain-containing protein n=1 Tax=Rosellinia necatrix TaxID=77044 RepID=A0A1W2TKB2_ROSNE|nr:hypothetical protein SAMD00023353_3300060 [Rosellinia necatrix]